MPNLHNYMKSALHGDRTTIVGKTIEYENTKEIRKSIESKEQSILNRIDVKNSSFDQSNSIIESKLALLILTYIYSQDDQEISKSEKRSIVKLLKKQNQFSSMDIEEILNFIDKLPNLRDVLNYVSDHNISNSSFNKVYTNVYRNMKHNNVYDNLLRSLKKHI